MASNYGFEEEMKVEVDDELLKRGFLPLPMMVVADKNLSAGAMITYGVLVYYGQLERDFPGQQAIVELTGASERSVREHMSLLVKHGYVESVRCGLGRPNKIVIKPLAGRTKESGQSGNICRSDRQILPDCQAENRLTLQADNRLSHISSNKESKLVTKTQKDSEKETPYAQGRVCGREREAGGGEESDAKQAETKAPRQLTLTQQAIQDAFNAFPLEGKATDPPGGRKRYSGLVTAIKEHGLPLVKEWTEWLKANPQTVPDEADEWAHFCTRFVDALRNAWKWQKQGAKQGGFSTPSQPQFSRSSGTVGADGKYPVPEGLLSPEGKDDPLFREFYAKNGPQKPITEHDTMSFGWWDGEWYKFQQLAGRDLPVRGGPHVGMLPSEVRRLYGDEDWERSLGG